MPMRSKRSLSAGTGASSLVAAVACLLSTATYANVSSSRSGVPEQRVDARAAYVTDLIRKTAPTALLKSISKGAKVVQWRN
jgi:hypothetical protein